MTEPEKSLLDEFPDITKARRPGRPRKDTIGDEQEKPETKRDSISWRPGMFVKPLTEMYEMIGGLLQFKDPVCGQAIVDAAEDCAKALDQLAKTNKAVRRILLKVIQTSDIGAIITAHAPIFLAVAMHHMPSLKAMGGVEEDAENVAGDYPGTYGPGSAQGFVA